MKNYYRFIVFAALSASLLTGCNPKTVSAYDKYGMRQQGGQGFTEVVDLPCQGMDSYEDFVVVNGEGKSRDRTMAKDRAYLNALGNLSSKLSGVAAREVERVGVSREAGDAENFQDKIVSVTREIAEAHVAGYRVSCEKTVVYRDGSYGHFVSLEFGKQKLVKELYNGLTRRKMLQIDYDYEKYSKKFSEDLIDYEREKK
jgi:hypothetical protein